MTRQPTVHLLSLGCPKNRVDSEVMLGHLVRDGYSPVDSPDNADVIVVNTCAFIDAAKEESVDAILEMGQYKRNGKRKGHTPKLVVAGCLSQRYGDQLAQEIPEVDHFLGTGNFETISHVLHGRTAQSTHRLPIVGQMGTSAEGHRREHGNHAQHSRLQGRNKLVPYRHDFDPTASRPVFIPDPDFSLTATSPRVSTLPGYTSYLKISEGCSNTCSFCIIPKLRGPQRSRALPDILEETHQLLDRGVVELNLIAQDLCAYGKDLQPKQGLAALLRALDKAAAQADHPVWIRCLYAYPRGLTREVIEVLTRANHIVPYLDMPLQHVSDKILRGMRRGKGGEATKDLLRRLRRAIPNLVLRTTFITGLPGETDDDFHELMEFVEELRFQHMGVFTYSVEEDTPAATMSGQVAADIAEERREKLMALQQQISRDYQDDLCGQTLDVLVEGVSQQSDLLLQGRHKGQAPDIDGLTYITAGCASPGEVVSVLIEEAGDYDLAGPIVEPFRGYDEQPTRGVKNKTPQALDTAR
ncbi:MAG: 30S ribosomal protein S12 methylthiotransferase RimO [Myxococcota bacterium]